MKTAGLQQTRPCTCLRQKRVGGKLQALVYDILPSSKVPERKRCSPRRKDVVNLCLEFGVVYLCVGSVCLEGRVAGLERSLVLNK